MTKNILKSHRLKLCISVLVFVNPMRGKQMTPTNIPTKVQPVNPIKPVQPVQPKPIVLPKNEVQPTKRDPEVLDINKSVKIINNQYDCSVDKWNNNQDEACQCCLTYGEGRFGEEQTADQIIDHCTHKSKQCSPTSIANIKRKYNAQNMSSDDFLNTLYNNTTVVNKVAFDKSLLSSDGSLTENLLSSILTQSYNEGILKNKAFSRKECLKIKKFGTISGYNTIQLFRVTSSCIPGEELNFFVKESKKGLTESTNLKKIENFPGMKEILAPNVVQGFPTIALPFFYFSYHPHHQNIHYIATIPGAEGIVLHDFLIEYRDNQTKENAERVKRAYYILGQELSNFHKKFMKPTPGKKLGKTVAHGDFHCQNIFYDEKTGHFTFIDNETMVRCFEKPKEPKVDFRRLILTPFTTNNTLLKFKEVIKGVNVGTYLNITLKPFIEGYISTYQPHERKQLLHDIKEIYITTTALKPWKLDPQYTQRYLKEYIIPIFNEIEKTLTK